MTIYQLFCGRQEQANREMHRGNVFVQMSSWPWQVLSEMGFDSVYLLGVFDHQGPILVTEEAGVQLTEMHDRVPSVFAITDHWNFDPNLGNLEQFTRLIKQVHDAKLKVIVDLVVNQTSTVHPWISKHPEYYKQGKTGLVPAFSQDVWLLDHEQPEVVEYFCRLIEWMAKLDIDGVRCDMAHLTKPELWKELISRARAVNNDFIFLAEAYSDSLFNWQPIDTLLELGFNAVYHEQLYRNLKQIFIDQAPWDHLTEHINFIIQNQRASKLIHYLSNHDDPLVETSSRTWEALFSLLWFLPGHLLVYNGTINGFGTRLAHHWLDVLEADRLELMILPNWFKNIARIRQAFNPVVTGVNMVSPGILEARLETKTQQWKLWVNSGLDDVLVPNNSAGEGLLHRLQSGEKLTVGQAELWFVD